MHAVAKNTARHGMGLHAVCKKYSQTWHGIARHCKDTAEHGIGLNAIARVQPHCLACRWASPSATHPPSRPLDPPT
eukprot:356305-Chlamydomonas_euryale.AAC.2